MFYELALEMVNTIKRHNAEGRLTVFICPVGPVGQYSIFVRMVNRDRVSLKNCWFLNMDEYLTDEGRVGGKEPSPLLPGALWTGRSTPRWIRRCLCPRPSACSPTPRPRNLQRVIAAVGGVDIAFGGIGINGHLAFNEAQDEAYPRRICGFAHPCAGDQPGNTGGKRHRRSERGHRRHAKKCVTIGMAQILGARKIRLGVFRDWHRSVVRQAAYGEVSAHFPATLVQRHPDALIIANANAAQQPF